VKHRIDGVQKGRMVWVKQMKRADRLADSEDALTAVIEFLTAFVLFLIILTAFFSLAGLQLGSNHPKSDQLDDYALQGLQRLTGDSGWYVPIDEWGDRDIANGTADWHHYNATILLEGSVQPGIAGDFGRLDEERLNAIANITQDQFIRGLGLPDWSSINLTIRIVESLNSSRVDVLLFQDGASRDAAANSAVAHRLMVLNDETVEIIFEVHDAGRTPVNLVLTEFMAEPEIGFPEWVELENRDGFAANLTGWGLGRATGGGLHSLIGDGALAGGKILLCSGKPSMQENQGAEVVLDLGQSSILGRGAVNGLNKNTDTLSLTWTYPGTAQTYATMEIAWDDDWEIGSNLSLQWNGGSASNSSNWDRSNGGTPGAI